ncbi:DUF2871 family protein [Amycolatopsis azurea]|uniref:DUF2871 family protein n=1 Tax=Amycolatopsis azurea TaxID=36819 RepID=UPI0037FFE659
MGAHLHTMGTVAFFIVLATGQALLTSRDQVVHLVLLIYNAGVVASVAMMVVHGSQTVLGHAVPAGLVNGRARSHIVHRRTHRPFVLLSRRPMELARLAA